MATRYPRGSKELRGAFYSWQPRDTVEWFAERGVELKTESDGRMFPVTDDSRTIITCFQDAARNAGVELRKEIGLKALSIHSTPSTELNPSVTHNYFRLQLTDGSQVEADKVLIATGSLKASPLSRALEEMGHTVAPLAPSLFAFNLADKRTHGLAGLSVQNASVWALTTQARPAKPAIAAKNVPHSLPISSRTAKPAVSQPQLGPVLITHRGLSGPAILRLSAWQARALQDENYHFEIKVNWLGSVSENQLREKFSQLRKTKGKTQIKTKVFEEIPRRLWERLVDISAILDGATWAQLSKEKEVKLIQEVIAGSYQIQGKTTNKDEFVTCGGVSLKEIHFKTMESRIIPNLYFAGECLDIDGITGGFNFQAAWTGGRLAGLAMANSE